MLLLARFGTASAQCTQCTPDITCSGQGGTQCPLSGQAPPMYLNNPYSTVVTFDMPPDTNVPGIGTVEIINVQYASITGLPIGITWSCNNTSNGCQYNPYGGETKACITFCGTPLSQPGNYTITINIYGTASTPIGNQTQYQPLEYVFTILPDTASNGYFTMSENVGCDSLDVDFEATYELPLPNMVSYDWDLGNGNTFSGPVPPTQEYNTPGTYYPTLTTHVSKLVISKVTASVSGGWYCGDVEEPNWPIVGCTAQPDVYFQIQQGSNIYTSSSTSDNANGSWDNLNLDLDGTLFVLTLWDDDPTSQDDNGGSTALNITGPGSYNYTTSGGFGTVEILQVPVNDIVTTDTIQVNSLPTVTDLVVSPADTVCEKETITISAPAGNYTYYWYKDGTAFGSDTLGPMITVLNESGQYSVRLVDNTTGCEAYMNPATVYFKPGVYNVTASYSGGVLLCNPATGFEYQWLFNGAPVFPGGDMGFYTPTAVGTYSCVVSNTFGCSDTTNTVQVTSLMGLETANISENLTLFPNPATDHLTVTFGSAADCSADIRILNNLGATVKTQRVTCTGGGNTFNVSVADLASGMYYLEFRTETGFAAKRFIKQ